MSRGRRKRKKVSVRSTARSSFAPRTYQVSCFLAFATSRDKRAETELGRLNSDAGAGGGVMPGVKVGARGEEGVEVREVR